MFLSSMAGSTSTLLLALAGLVTSQAPGRPREAGVPVPAVGDHAAYCRWMVPGYVTRSGGCCICKEDCDHALETGTDCEGQYAD